jgi:phage I-like protein
LTESDRSKYKAVKANYMTIAERLETDEVELVFVFQKGDGRLNPKNPNSSTYMQWAKQQGFRAIDTPFFPDEWFY